MSQKNGKHTSQEISQIVVAGGGFAGAYCTQALERKLRPEEARVTLINRTNYLLFTPLLIEAGTGALEPRHAVVPLRRMLHRSALHVADVTGVDFVQHRVFSRTFDGREHVTPYDHLVLALGSVTRLPDVPGLREWGYELKSLTDAVGLRDRAVGLLELANETDDPQLRRRMLTFVVVGGNYSGVEVAGEFNEFLRGATRLYRNLCPDDLRIVLVERGPAILNMLDQELSGYALKKLRQRGVEICLENTVTEILPDAAQLKNGRQIGTWTVIWTAGIAPAPLLEHLELPRDERGYLRCRPDMQVEGADRVWSVGDCAINLDPNGKPYPATAQHAVQEGLHVAANIVRTLHGEPTQPLVYRTKGMMAPLGQHQGVARVFSWKLSGLTAWLLWRTFYLLMMPGLGRSIRVLMDWTLDWFFRRDYVQLGIHRMHRAKTENTERLEPASSR